MIKLCLGAILSIISAHREAHIDTSLKMVPYKCWGSITFQHVLIMEDKIYGHVLAVIT